MRKFKKGDLIQMNNQFCSTRHPPMGTYGIVTYVEDSDCPTIDGNSSDDVTVDVDQFVRVYWAHHKNSGDQCYMDTSLKKAKA
jgi:hypothetical protein